MRFRLALGVLACGCALAAGGALAADSNEDTKKKEQPAPKSKQEQAAADKAAADKAAKEKAEAPKAEAQPGQPKAAVNTIEDLFAAYGLTAWTSPNVDTTVASETVVWRESVAPKPGTPTAKPKQ